MISDYFYTMKVLVISSVILLLWVLFAQSCMSFRTNDRDAKQEFEKKGVSLMTASVNIDGHTIHYVQSGNDSLPTIIFIHGTPGSWNSFERYLSDTQLLQHFRLISIDRPGFGYSDFGNPEHLQKQSALIGPLIASLKNGKPVYLAGHSYGGPLVFNLAADNPYLFAGLVIISGSVDPAKEKPEKWRPVLFRTPLNHLVPGAMRPSNVELWYLKKDLVLLREDFGKIHCPVIFIHGDKDTWVPPGNVTYAQALLVNAASIKVFLLPGADHFIPWTRYAEIKAVLLKLGQSNAGGY